LSYTPLAVGILSREGGCVNSQWASKNYHSPEKVHIHTLTFSPGVVTIEAAWENA
jgi:hypothetical protein